jgi:hypothetical protein
MEVNEASFAGKQAMAIPNFMELSKIYKNKC